MKVEQIYTGCLAEAAYYIESAGEAAIIDPLREVAPYLKKATRNGAKIKYIFETHFHADFVSGHVDLAKQTGAKIVYGPGAQTDFEAHIAKDGEVFSVGNLTITALHTPGHTSESTTFLLKDDNGNDYCIFTGDTLFIGDVGRPDLAQQGNQTMGDMAAMLYDSLHAKIFPLADEVLVYPAHGAGSACGKNMSKETFDTLGHQKKVNYALKAKDKATFISQVTNGILPPPAYFAKNAQLNKTGYQPIGQVFEKGLKALDPSEFEELAQHTRALVIDARNAEDFAQGFIPKSINIGLNGQFAPWVGTLVPDLAQPILLVVEPGKEEEAITRLARVGYDYTLGYLKGGFRSWQNAGKAIDTVAMIAPTDFERRYRQKPDLLALDVRKSGEYEAEHLEIASSRPLDFINEWTSELDPAETYYIHCAGGYRSMIAAAILKARGFENVIDIAGGYKALKQTHLKRTDFNCSTKENNNG